MGFEESVTLVKNIAKAIIAVIEIFEQEKVWGMDVITGIKVTCKVAGLVFNIMKVLNDQQGVKFSQCLF